MRFPGRQRELHADFVNAADPDLSHLRGEYLVNILMVPGYSMLNHRKVFYAENDTIYGYNILFHKTWGRFRIEDGYAALPDPLNVAVINYNRSENSFLIRRIRDHIRCVQKNKLYIGRANYLLRGRPRFLGYFSLEKIT